ncbi:hypothetical protein B0O95_13311 [Mycetohabitans endofungorum]|uniref:Uncharacterized protein n=1 Tax=Mycetohabitans endofungorum TaxID=417203 RepID=A0A2P5K6I6_9BURK|nr:hypothetical protein B0O95_13311 [Mycetohabitans endofungorum]
MQKRKNAPSGEVQGEHFKESHVMFLSWQEMVAALTPKRLDDFA